MDSACHQCNISEYNKEQTSTAIITWYRYVSSYNSAHTREKIKPSKDYVIRAKDEDTRKKFYDAMINKLNSNRNENEGT